MAARRSFVPLTTRPAERRFLPVLSARMNPPSPPDLAEALTVRAALAELTPRQRAAVVLRFLDDLDLTSTASVMRCSPGTVKKLTARGLATLRTRLGSGLDTGGDDA